jgi:hypothetical protein
MIETKVRTEVKAMLAINEAPMDLYYYGVAGIDKSREPDEKVSGTWSSGDWN